MPIPVFNETIEIPVDLVQEEEVKEVYMRVVPRI
jgi:hypothetical protein